MIEGLLGLALMMVLCAIRIPISFAMAIVGFVGYAYMRDWNWTVAFAMTQTKLYETGRNYTLSVVPLFILMGNFVTRAGSAWSSGSCTSRTRRSCSCSPGSCG